ncbi:MAG: glycosyltransferase family 39 protein [Gaiella sp.]
MIVAAAAAVPRLVVLAVEREGILEEFVEKSDTFARTLVASGTFGFLEGVPSAYTQPLYAWFLAALYWPFGHSWLAVGLVQTLLAVATALVVFDIGRRVRHPWVGLIGALVSTVHPYVVWHDVHVNREILDGLLLALLVRAAVEAYARRSLLGAAACGALAGLAILGNARLALLPLVVAGFLAFGMRRPLRGAAAAVLVLAATAIVVAPWAYRNHERLGCWAITTDTRALWKANNENTYETLARGLWIDDVPELPGAPVWPEKAASISRQAALAVDECAQSTFYRGLVTDFWREQPGEKAKLAAQAVGMLWRPTFTTETAETAGGRAATLGRRVVEPVYMSIVFVLAALGALLAPRRFVWLAALLLGYNTLAAMAFAGTVRYRAPWDFLPALLAGYALLWLIGRRPRRRRFTTPL